MGSLSEWAMVVVTGVSAYFIYLQLRANTEQLRTSNEQLRTSHKELHDDHERSRRQLAVKLLQDWTTGLQFGMVTVLYLAMELSQDQCNAVAGLQPLSLDDNTKYRDLLKRVIDLKWPRSAENEKEKEKITVDKGKITVDGECVVFIRTSIINYLNLLESILTAWRSNVASETILEEQFRCLLRVNDLARFRTSMENINLGTNTYPSIAEFMQKLRPPGHPRPGVLG
jgi:hypothetical protein